VTAASIAGAADPQVPVAAAGPRRAAGAVVAGRGLVLPVVVDGGLAAADAAGGQGLQVRGALPDRAGAGGAFPRRDIAGQPALDVLVGVPVGEPVMVAGDEHLPLVSWQVTAAGAQPAALINVPFGPGPPVGVGAGVGRMPQRRQHRLIGRLHPGDLGKPSAHGSGLLQRPAQVLLTQPQPDRARRPACGELPEHRGDDAGHRLVGVEDDLPGRLAPDQPGRQAAAQLAAGGLVADPAGQPCPQHVELCLLCGLLRYADHEL
jgi:hypothetical protein